jgi:hypothetical protein
MVSSTQDFVGNFIFGIGISDYNLFTLGHHISVDNAGIMCGRFATPTERPYLKGLYTIC